MPKLAAIFSRHGEQFGGIRFYSESACVNCIFLRYERVFNSARKAATSATHIKVIARVICIAHSPHLFSAKSRIPPNCSPCQEKNLRGGIESLGSLSLYLCSHQMWVSVPVPLTPKNLHWIQLYTIFTHCVYYKSAKTHYYLTAVVTSCQSLLYSLTAVWQVWKDYWFEPATWNLRVRDVWMENSKWA